MSYETIPVEMKDSGTVHVLTGTVTDTGDGIVDLDIDGYSNFTDVPVFYHCENEETADGMPFSIGDRVVIVNTGSTVILSVDDMRVVGFEDGLPRNCLIETVYVTMTVGITNRCFVWNAGKNIYAEIKLNVGGQASFPCDPADISDWRDDQTEMGESLYAVSDCGRSPFYSPEVSCGVGSWGTSGSKSDSKEEPSTCDAAFIDTGNCTTSWDLTTVCYWAPGHWIWAGSHNNARSSHVLYQGSKFLESQNNSEIESAFKIEREETVSEARWSADGAACSGEPCDNIRMDSGAYTKIYKYHTPLGSDILEINGTASKSWDMCADTGAYQETNYLSGSKLNCLGVYSEEIIAQIYTIEARTVTRTLDGASSDSGCVGGTCEWISQDYTTYGLNLTAQVGVFKGDVYPDGTDGVDPTGLSCNSSFESAITGMYDSLRTAESVPDDEMAYATISLSILNG